MSVTFRFLAVGFAVLACVGCRTPAPITVWAPPELENAVGHRIGISSIDGPSEIAGPLREKLLTVFPQDTGRALVAVDPHQLPLEDAQSNETIRLVSATEQLPTVLSAAAIAKQQGIDYLLTGQVLPQKQNRLVRRRPGTTDADNIPVFQASELDQDGKLSAGPPGAGVPAVTFSWRLISVKDNRAVGGKPFTIDLDLARKTYPDLALVADPKQALATAAARDAYRLITPSLRHHQIDLSVPRMTWGARTIRRGNAEAASGNWGAAAQIWQSVLDRHPHHPAALHNMALAAAAGQDFSQAKELARRAIRLNPSGLHQETLVWIEQRQRDYHEAFGYADPPEGWFLVRPPALDPIEETP